MTKMAEWLKDKLFAPEDHPYRILERAIHSRLEKNFSILDAGCGYTAPVLSKYSREVSRSVGIDLVDFENNASSVGLELYNASLDSMPIEDESINLGFSRSVFEHLENPEKVYREINRILKPGASFFVLTPNKWDYASIVSMLVPNSLHPYIVSKTEGRKEKDVFPAYYKTNTLSDVRKLAAENNLELVSFEYYGQYPNYFMFNGLLFLLASMYEKIICKFNLFKIIRGWIFVEIKKPM